MKTINLYFDFEFTSLSPDAQLISLGIVSDDIKPKLTGNAIHDLCNPSFVKSFYAEFSDFDINRCDDWVKENVVKKLKILQTTNYFGFDIKNSLAMLNCGIGSVHKSENEINVTGATELVKSELKKWISQLSDYQIQFVCDCGTFDWYWMLQLLAEWEETKYEWCPVCGQDASNTKWKNKTGLPKLPENISPVPQDLNDLIAFKKGISVREAFELNREELSAKWEDLDRVMFYPSNEKHNSLFDAKVIKAIYEKLK